ncbi:MAG TPA: GtrA family protein [Gaiellaceae bacterium]
MERSGSAAVTLATARSRAGAALSRPHNWVQLAKFCAVGAIGYAVNLAVYSALLRGAGIHYLAAAACSFLVAVANNYTWNRLWTFRGQRGHFAYQGLRFLIVSVVALGANLLVLHVLVGIGLGKIAGQAVAIILVTPLNFLGNKLWSFRLAHPAGARSRPAKPGSKSTRRWQALSRRF